jgi:AcrR family transcriptional regulator
MIGHVSTTPVQELPRRRLSTKRSLTVDRLTDAAVDELHATGYSGLTVRAVAARCGVAPATAYNYFSSKEHLIAEVFWRRISAQDEAAPQGTAGLDTAAQRATEVLANFALVVSNETELAAACTVALLVDNPEVHELRLKIGRLLHTRLVAALGEPGTGAAAPPAAVRTLEFVVSGALIEVGTGHLPYDQLRNQLAEATTVILGDPVIVKRTP